MSTRPLLTKWIGDYCAPVVVTVATAEVENICLKNGLLLHELLSGFGKLEGANATIRSTNSQIEINDANIRFERGTEVRSKNAGGIEELLRTSFEDYDLSRIPTTLADLKVDPPTTWCPNAEQLVLRSMAFSDVEMISHPVVLLLVVATTDVDPVACMQELASVHHVPQCMISGQYDKEAVHKVYLLIHDMSSKSTADLRKEYETLRGYFPATHTKYLALNSRLANQPCLDQIDIWSSAKIPMFYPQLAPSADFNLMPPNPANGRPALGCCLSPGDLVCIKEFCSVLFHQAILPCMERRIANLSKNVADARKGVKNVLKSFWRKPREESPSRVNGTGTLRYRFDRIEAQILLLADTCFIIKDYEAASQMYKLAKEDFKSDKSTTHLAHATLMAAICHLITEPNKPRDTSILLEGLTQLIGVLEPIHASAQYALLASEVHLCLSTHSSRSSIDASHLLLQAASNVPKLTLMCAMLTERASICYLHAGQARKFAFYQALCGYKYQGCGMPASQQAVVCFLSAMTVYEKTRWGYIKSTIARSLAAELKQKAKVLSNVPPDPTQEAQLLRALLMTLKAIIVALSDDRNVGCKTALKEAEPLLIELMRGQNLSHSQRNVLFELAGNIQIHEGWSKHSSHGTVLGDLPLTITPPPAPVPSYRSIDDEGADSVTSATISSPGRKTISGVFVPELNLPSLDIITPVNGPFGNNLLNSDNKTKNSNAPIMDEQSYKILKKLKKFSSEMSIFLSQEIEFYENEKVSAKDNLILNATDNDNNGDKNGDDIRDELAEKWAESLSILDPAFCTSSSSFDSSHLLTTESYHIHPTHVTKVSEALSNKEPTHFENRNEIIRIPVGESVTVRAEFRNKLSTKINLTDLRLEITPSNDFTVTPYSATVSSNSRVDMLVQSMAVRTGLYKIVYLRWNLGEFVAVRHPLFRQGLPLQKTMQNRAGRHKGEDKSLCFEIVPAQPLLTLSLQGLNCPLSLPPSPPTPPSSSSLFPSQPLPRTNSSQTNSSSSSSSSTDTKEPDIHLLQGQILETILTVKNDGAAPASEIFVKFSHPNIILSKVTTENHRNNQVSDNGFELEPLYGRSGTVLKLLSTDNQPLLPGCEVKYRFFLRLTEIGKHRVSVIASCVCKNSGLESEGPQSHEAPTTPGFGVQGGQGLGPKHRTSIISFQAMVLPSLEMTVRSLGCTCAISERTLMLNFSNCLRPAPVTVKPANAGPPSAKGYDRLWHDIPTPTSSSFSGSDQDTAQDVQESSIKIEGILILGGISPVKYLSSSDETISFVTGASEKSTLGIRINIENGNNSDVNKIEIDGLCDENKKNSNNNSNEKKEKVNCAWVLPLSQESSNNTTQLNNSNTNKTIKVIERFQCLKKGGTIFSNDVLKAKKLKLKEEFTDAETGPRSIAQVRRENKKSDNDSGKENNLIDMMENINITENENENGIGNENEKKESQIISKRHDKFSENALDLAKSDCDNNSITVIVYWVSRVSGIITRGMHALENVSILPEMASLTSTLSNPSNNIQKDDIISKFDDASDYLSLALKYPTSATLPLDNKSKNINVYLDIKSNSKKILIVSAEIIDKKNRATTPEIGLNSTNIDRNPNFHSQRGLRWERKTNITDIVLLPYEMKSVPFHAVVSMPGAFDLNRFKVSVRYGNTDDDDNDDKEEGETVFGLPPAPSVKYICGHCLIEVL